MESKMADRSADHTLMKNIGYNDKTESILHKNSKIIKARRKDIILEPAFNVTDAWDDPPEPPS